MQNPRRGIVHPSASFPTESALRHTHAQGQVKVAPTVGSTTAAPASTIAGSPPLPVKASQGTPSHGTPSQGTPSQAGPLKAPKVELKAPETKAVEVQVEDFEYLLTYSYDVKFATHFENVKSCDACEELSRSTTDSTGNSAKEKQTVDKSESLSASKSSQAPASGVEEDEEEEEEEDEEEDEVAFQVSGEPGTKSRRRKPKCVLKQVPFHLHKLWMSQKGLCASCEREPLSIYSNLESASNFRFMLRNPNRCPTVDNIEHLICVPCLHLLQACMHQRNMFNKMRDLMFSSKKMRHVYHMYHLPSAKVFYPEEKKKGSVDGKEAKDSKDSKVRIRLSGVPAANLRTLWSDQGAFPAINLLRVP
jgi:hypothetical protein